MELATTIGDFYRCTNDQLKAIECTAKCGFKYLDYSFGLDYRERSGFLLSDSGKYLNDVLGKCDELNVKFVQAHAPIGSPLSDDNDVFVNDNIKCIEACGKLGIKNIVIHSDYVQNLSKKETFEKNKRFYEKLFPTAEKYGVNILTENFNKMVFDDIYWIDNAPDLLEFVEYVNHPLFHVVWDTGHGNHQKMTQEESLAILGKHVKALHVHDNDGKDDQHMCPFCGTLDINSLMNGLKNIDYDGYFTFEAGNFFATTEFNNTNLNDNLEFKFKAVKLLYTVGEKILASYS